ncbi:MAG: Hpy99I family type II restriction endonuclease [Ignavibacteriaceae bacterium]|nr:Hpy99I family type II restriction endonuclease [Ignavibacteriaceae bacterium]
MLRKDDFVILTESHRDILINSVGIITSISKTRAEVFFIGKRISINLNLNRISFLDIEKTGKPYDYKICNICHVLKNERIDFNINQTDAKGRKTTRPSCKKCRIEIDGVALKLSEKRRLDKVRPKHFFICPICQKGSIPNVTANFVMDHDHQTGNAREWICDSCNTGLGRFKDDISLLKKAIKYLQKHNQNN